MGRQIRIKAVRKREIDDAKLALAFLLLAKILDEQSHEICTDDGQTTPEKEAA